MDRKAFVYLAGAISQPDPMINVRTAVGQYEQMIRDGVVTPFCPHLSILVPLIVGHGGISDHEYWLPHDFEVIDRCDALLRLDGESVGADAEVHYARTGRDGKGSIPVFTTIEALYTWAREYGHLEPPVHLYDSLMNPDGAW